MEKSLITPEMQEVINEKIKDDWSLKPVGDYRVPIALEWVASHLQFVTVYVSKNHASLKGVWLRRNKIINEAEKLGFITKRRPKYSGDEPNMEWKFMTFLTPLDQEDGNCIKEIKQYIDMGNKGKLSGSIFEMPFACIRIDIKNWQNSDRELTN